MRVCIVDRHGPGEHARPWLDAFQAGMLHAKVAHACAPAVTVERVPEEMLTPCDLAVFWSHKAHDWIDQQRIMGGHYVVLERGFIGDRTTHTSVGLDGLNGRAFWPMAGFMFLDDWARFESVAKMKPWRYRDPRDAVVIMGQCAGDEATKGVDLDAWYAKAAAAARRLYPEGELWFRPHPLQPFVRVDGVRTLPGNADFSYAMLRTQAVITYNSTSAVDAILEGVPAHCDDPCGSMAASVARHGLDEPAEPTDRERWAKRLAWTQWTRREISVGTPWRAIIEHLGNRDARWRS